jgi:hypothetical protein
MQGALVGDDQTPPASLERELAERSGLPVSVLNTGVLGYSPEQYYYTLLQFADRIRPHFVIVSLCGNDFGEWHNLANWEESCSWLFRINDFCRSRQITYLIVPWPGEEALLSWRDESVYPGQASHVLRFAGVRYFYPVEAFTNEDLRLRLEFQLSGKPADSSPLYNRHLLGDSHMSPLGCALWGRVVADRLCLILEREGRLPAHRRTLSPSIPISGPGDSRPVPGASVGPTHQP